MGRKKRRRLRDRALGPGVAVETVEFEVDSTSETDSSPAPGGPSEDSERETVPSSQDETQTLQEATPRAESHVDEVPPEPVPDVQTLGELLQQAREDRGLSLEAASARTRISTHMLRHLENDRFGEFAAEAYVKGFLRNYGGFLGLDVGMLLRRYEAISGRLVERDPEILELDTLPRPRRRRNWRRLLWPILAILMLGAVSWIFWSRGAARLGLRPQPGLEQIEEELRDRSPSLTVPGLVPSEPSILLPEPQGSPAPAIETGHSGRTTLPTSEQGPVPASPVPRPATPTERSEPAGEATPAAQPVEDLVPPERP